MIKNFNVSFISAEETRPVRFRVLWPHKPNANECVIDIDHASGARHIGASDVEGQQVGVCSLFDQRSDRFPSAIPLTDSVYRLRVIGTIPEVRGEGAGAAIIDFACAWCRQTGVEWLWCDAREVAFGFYQKMGFDFVSGPYQVPNIGTHRMMARKL
jgi:GNAT superfamily N-acetyltransferase